MKKIIAVLLLFCFAFPAYADELAGLWKTPFGCYFNFKPDGTFSYINYKTKTGYFWKRVDGNKVAIAFSYIPSSGVQQNEYDIRVDGDKLFFRSSGQEYVFTKSSEKVTVFKGEIFYRERIQLPPKVEVRYELYKNSEKVPFAMYSIPTEGKIPMPFSFDCIAAAEDKIYVNAVIYHENMPLFATPDPVDVTEGKILLHKADQSMTQKKVAVPGKFSNAEGDTLYLEKNGLAILKKGEEFSVAHWALVDRNHNIEITQSGSMPLTAALQDESTLVFRHYNDKNMVSFHRTDSELFGIGKFCLYGNIVERDNGLYFVDCIANCNFAVQFPKFVYNSLKKDNFSEPCAVKMEAVLRRNAEGELDLYPLRADFDDTEICSNLFRHTTLENTYWRLIRLNEKAARTYEGQGEPHIIIRDTMLSGSDGCNNFFMPVEFTEKSIKIGQGGSTLMLCPQGEEQAREFNQVLQSVDSWQIKGSVLTLLRNNIVLALFEAVYL